LRRQPYSVVLLDQQMPGRRGLELLGEIRAIDPAMPVVMVTQSEDEGTLREAIGIEVDDYLVKPVHPRQVLSVVTRLLEGDRIRQQRRARDFVTRFRELEARRGATLAWREWVELVAELTRWEVRLAGAHEPGLSEALRTLQQSLRHDFSEFFRRHYPKWLANPEGDRPPLSVDVGAEFLVPVLQAPGGGRAGGAGGGRVLFIVIDCLRLDQWEALRDLVTPLFDVEESHYFSIVPTATPFSRNAIFSGMFPMEIAARHPNWWGAPSDEESLNAHEAELLTEQLQDLVGKPVAVRYEKLFSASDGEELLRRLPAHLAQDGVTALVFNFIDQLTHGRSESAILYEVARDADALRGLTRTWFERSPVLAALQEAERRGVPVLLTTDHGSIHCETPATVYAKRDATANLRYKFGEDLRAEDPEAAILVEDLKAYGLPGMGLGVRMLLATGDRFFVYPTKLREYQARYRGSFLHGGVTPEEVILPVVLLTPRRGVR
jgi:CheY-like chemotaxis protein